MRSNTRFTTSSAVTRAIFRRVANASMSSDLVMDRRDRVERTNALTNRVLGRSPGSSGRMLARRALRVVAIPAPLHALAVGSGALARRREHRRHPRPEPLLE